MMLGVRGLHNKGCSTARSSGKTVHSTHKRRRHKAASRILQEHRPWRLKRQSYLCHSNTLLRAACHLTCSQSHPRVQVECICNGVLRSTKDILKDAGVQCCIAPSKVLHLTPLDAQVQGIQPVPVTLALLSL